MAVLKCKMCGGDLKITDGAKFAECEHCGTMQTVADSSDEKKANLFNRANILRMNCEFDKAAGVYESIVSEYPEEAEGYWGLVLCDFGIEYVNDERTGKKIPTCHRTSTTSVMDDDNFIRACDYSDVLARGILREEAKVIDGLQKKIISVVENEEPYDVFICYKETDDITKQRTEDSQIAQDIYTELIKDGYKVFFSRVTLRGKAGMEYEPYIYAALKSAKIMLAIGTKFDYYDAVWVKNEWSRYIKMMAEDDTKHLIPCFKNLDAYDIPKEFKNLQALDMAEVTFFKNLMENVNHFIPKAGETKQETYQAAPSATYDSKVQPLLERARMFLEDENFQSADEYCEKVLDLDPKNATAYLYKLMAECKVQKIEELINYKASFEHKDSYEKFVRFGDEKTKAILRDYLTQIKERIENNRIKMTYSGGKSLMASKHYSDAIREFQKILTYKDSKELIEQCKKEMELHKQEIENERREQARIEAEKKAHEEKAAEYARKYPLWNKKEYYQQQLNNAKNQLESAVKKKSKGMRKLLIREGIVLVAFVIYLISFMLVGRTIISDSISDSFSADPSVAPSVESGMAVCVISLLVIFFVIGIIVYNKSKEEYVSGVKWMKISQKEIIEVTEKLREIETIPTFEQFVEM